MPPVKLLKVPEAAELLALSQKTVWQWIAERRVGVVRLGRAVRIPLRVIRLDAPYLLRAAVPAGILRGIDAGGHGVHRVRIEVLRRDVRGRATRHSDTRNS